MIDTKEQYEEYGSSISDTYSADDWGTLWDNDIRPTIEALREVARAAKWKPDYTDMRQAIRWSKGNYRNVGDYPTVKWGAESYLESDRMGRIEEALDALPDWLTDES